MHEYYQSLMYDMHGLCALVRGSDARDSYEIGFMEGML